MYGCMRECRICIKPGGAIGIIILNYSSCPCNVIACDEGLFLCRDPEQKADIIYEIW